MSDTSLWRTGSGTNGRPATDLSAVGLGSLAGNAGTLADWQQPIYGANGSFFFPLFGSAANPHAVSAPPPTPAPTPPPISTPPSTTPPGGRTSVGPLSGGGGSAIAGTRATGGTPGTPYDGTGGAPGTPYSGMGGRGQAYANNQGGVPEPANKGDPRGYSEGIGAGSATGPGDVPPSSGANYDGLSFDNLYSKLGLDTLSNSQIGGGIGGALGSLAFGPIGGLLGMIAGRQLADPIANEVKSDTSSSVTDDTKPDISSNDQSSSDTSSGSAEAGSRAASSNSSPPGYANSGDPRGSSEGWGGNNAIGPSDNAGNQGGESGDSSHAAGGFIHPNDLVAPAPAPDVGYASVQPGEFVVRASQAQQYAPILQAINNGSYDPANPPGVSPAGGSNMSGSAPFATSMQQMLGMPGQPQMQNPGDPSQVAAGDSDMWGYSMAGPQDPANMSPLMPFPQQQALTPDMAMQRLAMLPSDQRAAIAQVSSDPNIAGALLSVLGPTFASFIQAAQTFSPMMAQQPGAGGMEPDADDMGGPSDNDADDQGGQQMNGMPNPNSGFGGGRMTDMGMFGGAAGGAATSPGGPISAVPGGGKPGQPMPHAMGGFIRRQDVTRHPVPSMGSAPPGHRPASGLSRVGMPARSSY